MIFFGTACARLKGRQVFNSLSSLAVSHRLKVYNSCSYQKKLNACARTVTALALEHEQVNILNWHQNCPRQSPNRRLLRNQKRKLRPKWHQFLQLVTKQIALSMACITWSPLQRWLYSLLPYAMWIAKSQFARKTLQQRTCCPLGRF